MSRWPDPSRIIERTHGHTYQLVIVVLKVKRCPTQMQKPRVAMGKSDMTGADLLSI